MHQSKKDETLFAFYEQMGGSGSVRCAREVAHMKAMREAIKGKTAPGGGVTFYEYLQ